MTPAPDRSAPLTLVTGGTGFVGRHLVRALLAQGQPVRLLCRHPARAQALFGDAIQPCPGDLLQPASLTAACRGVRQVFHLGGAYAFGPQHRDDLRRTNVDGASNLFAACWEARVERVVHCSTAGILTPNHETPSPPTFPDRPPFGCHYKRSKWEGERVALAWAQRGLPILIASPTAVLGAEDERPTPTGRMVLDLMEGRFPAYARTGLNGIAVGDVAAGLLAIADRGVAGQRYLLAHRNLWLSELLAILARAAQVPMPRWVVPASLLVLGGWLGEAWGLAARNGSVRLCLETAHFARRLQFFNAAATTAAIGWTPRIPIETAAAEAVAWFAHARRRATALAPECARPALGA